eukprot:Gregarina_sp_Pseudo_9__1610@NODE_2085_length_1158_cov_149_051832_g1926_i0_p1_GENE_NODE_2085_length_1158_cov_149_051832_g1926_i0NODE_2085_length_1158_cov_149_051832_g1926_i0_p1_ORF_typecomplete_len271_score45_25GST_C_3/PF14497_6/3_8e03GST_C_3/PF14497_6/1_7e16GST_C/PF00043_25/0_00011GST_C_2/PF13410_6/0_00055Y2_Tnp/PF04986_13/0_022_NODE_2085_length_1158_cov_149_051832_g1926_i03451061
MTKPWTLYYWPGIPGRGEYVRLVLEFASQSYTEVSDPNELTKMWEAKPSKEIPIAPFAPPYLKTPEGWMISQTPNIINFLGQRLKLSGSTEEEGLLVNQLVLTVLDLALEAHDSHHPIASCLYYEDQKVEAKRRSDDFKTTRLPKFLGYFDRLLSAHPHSHVLVGDGVTVADLTLFHTLRGIQFAFPNRYKKAISQLQALQGFWHKMETLPEIAKYLQQPNRLQFKDGLFRHYPELDD